MFKLVLEKAEEPEIKLPTSTESKKQESSRKTFISALLTMPKPFLVIHTHTQRTHTRKCSNNDGVVYEISKPTYMVSH